MTPSDALLKHFTTIGAKMMFGDQVMSDPAAAADARRNFQGQVRHYRDMCRLTPPWPELDRMFLALNFGTPYMTDPQVQELRAFLAAL